MKLIIRLRGLDRPVLYRFRHRADLAEWASFSRAYFGYRLRRLSHEVNYLGYLRGVNHEINN
jgi:hypothetical protein